MFGLVHQPFFERKEVRDARATSDDDVASCISEDLYGVALDSLADLNYEGRAALHYTSTSCRNC